MKRLIACATLIALVVLVTPATATAAVAPPPPTSDFGGSWTNVGSVVGTLTWYGRSVGVNGAVNDYETAGSTTVIFEFRQGSTLLDVQTRTASNGAKGFGWTEPGPRGGITKVDIYLSHNGQTRFIDSVPAKGA